MLLLMHGAGGSHLVWPREIQRLTGTNVYNLDLPGHGRSVGPGRSTVEGYADVVQEFIEALDLFEVTLMGHSMGGAIAQMLALRQLPQIGKMIIVNSSAKLRVAPQILDLVSTKPELATDFVVRTSWGSNAAENMIEIGQRNMMQIDPAVLYGDFLACDCFDIRTRLNQILIPTLVISSSEDDMVPLKFGRYLAEHINDARLVTIEGAGHFSMLERPQAVADAIADFLANDLS